MDQQAHQPAGDPGQAWREAVVEDLQGSDLMKGHAVIEDSGLVTFTSASTEVHPEKDIFLRIGNERVRVTSLTNFKPGCGPNLHYHGKVVEQT